MAERDYGGAAVAEADAHARVLSSHDWTAAGLAHHLAEVYRHKVECIQQGRFPDPWSPDSVVGEPDPMLRWLWKSARQVCPGLRDAGLLDQFRTLRVANTQ